MPSARARAFGNRSSLFKPLSPNQGATRSQVLTALGTHARTHPTWAVSRPKTPQGGGIGLAARMCSRRASREEALATKQLQAQAQRAALRAAPGHKPEGHLCPKAGRVSVAVAFAIGGMSCEGPRPPPRAPLRPCINAACGSRRPQCKCPAARTPPTRATSPTPIPARPGGLFRCPAMASPATPRPGCRRTCAWCCPG